MRTKITIAISSTPIGSSIFWTIPSTLMPLRSMRIRKVLNRMIKYNRRANRGLSHRFFLEISTPACVKAFNFWAMGSTFKIHRPVSLQLTRNTTCQTLRKIIDWKTRMKVYNPRQTALGGRIHKRFPPKSESEEIYIPSNSRTALRQASSKSAHLNPKSNRLSLSPFRPFPTTRKKK